VQNMPSMLAYTIRGSFNPNAVPSITIGQGLTTKHLGPNHAADDTYWIAIIQAKQRLLAAAVAVCAVVLSVPAPVWGQSIPGNMARTWLFHMLRMEANPNFIEHSRLGAMTMVAVHDAVNSISGVRRYKRYLDVPEQPIVSDASPVAAVAAAAYEVLERYRAEIAGRQCGGPPGFTAEELLAEYNISLAPIPSDVEKALGIQVGRTAGRLVWENRETDGWRPDPCANPPLFALEHYDTELPQPDGVYNTLYPSFFEPFGQPNRWWWGNLPVWTLTADLPTSAAWNTTFRSDPPPSLTSTDFLEGIDQTRRQGSKFNSTRSQSQSEGAQWWQLCRGTGYGAVPRIASQLTLDFGYDLQDTARVFALVTVSKADALIANINSKNVYNFWRPYTAIRRLLDPAWEPFILTPPNQEFPAGHPMVSGGAGVGVLALEFGDGPLPKPLVITGSSLPIRGVCDNPTRTFPSLAHAIADVVDARVSGGMHFLFSAKEGRNTGRRIAEHVYDNFFLPL
jgi:hypothetical protein